MPITIPSLDSRRYQDMLDEARARIPVHTPEWTNFNESDPGVTLLELFAFLAENMAYRANLIPERNRLKFLTLLGIPLAPGTSARGLVTINNERGELRTLTLNDDLEVRAGQAPFRTEMGLDVLPVEMQVFYKRAVSDAAPEVREYYRQLYASYMGSQPLNATDALLYDTQPFPATGGVDLGVDTIDAALWVALLLRPGDKPYDEAQKRAAREAIANRTLSLGLLPMTADASGKRLDPVGQESAAGGNLLRFELPLIPSNGELSRVLSERVPRYQALTALASDDVLARPGVVQLRLPDADQLRLWTNVDPLEMGVGSFPPSLEDTTLNDRLITWLRISSPAAVRARFLWVGGNATAVRQRTRVANELLPAGTGEPDQNITLTQAPVIPDSLRLTVTENGKTEAWTTIDDLYAAGPEVPTADPRLPPGAQPPPQASPKAYTLNPESGEVRFGDGTHGARPSFGAILRADYDVSMGGRGNVGAGAINSGPALPSGLKVTNPVPTWGGADPESVREGEKQVTRYLQHRDRLVTAADFETIVRRTPGVDVGRVEVLPAYNPEIGASEPGDAAGAVTLMLVPAYDPAHPNAPVPDRLFLDAVCEYVNPRRLVTTEVLLRPPNYRKVWVSIGITVAQRTSLAQVTEAVKAALHRFLSPLPAPESAGLADAAPLFVPAAGADPARGWPLRKPVLKLEIAAVANRAPGVLLVNSVLLIDEARNPRDEIPMTGLDLPALAGLAVGIGEAPPASSIPGFGEDLPAAGGPAAFAPVPRIPEECR